MDRQQPSGVLPRRPFVRFIKINLALGFLFLFLFSGYQPHTTFPPIKKTTVFAQEQEQVKTVQAQNTSLAFQTPHPGYLSTRFSGYHPGIDLATGLGMPVKPIAKGTIVSAGFSFWGLGLRVEVDHGEGYHSVYGHMGTIYVKPGQLVDNGSLLGVVGMTGNTSGPHTHLEVYKDGKAIDPTIILPPVRLQPQESDFIAVGGNYGTLQQQAPVTQVAAKKTAVSTPTPTTKPVEIKKPELQLSLTPQTNTTPELKEKAKDLLNLH